MASTDATKSKLIAAAQSLPGLIAAAKVQAPDLAASLEGKSLMASKSPWGALLGGIIGLVSAKFGFGWDADTSSAIAGLGVLVGGYVMRLITRAPITSVLPTSTPKV